jgi:hypothetical protein
MDRRVYGSRVFARGAVLAVAAAAIILAGCSSGLPPAGVKGFAKGVITAKGSIFVNGVEYETTGSQVTVNNLGGSAADLKVGMVVSVKGYIDPATGKGTATEIDYAKSIAGTIDSLNATTGVMVVFGITVTTDASTVYEGVSGFAALAPGDLVDVSGTASSTGIAASRVEKKTSEDFNLKGTVSGLAAGTFTLTTETGVAFTVNFTGTLASGIANGSTVEVEFSTPPAGGIITVAADKISTEHKLQSDSGDRGEVSGVVRDFVAGTPTTFTVDGTSVSADPSLVGGVATGV